MQPPYGKTPGGDVLTITGSGFGIDANLVSVKIENVPCSVTDVIDT